MGGKRYEVRKDSILDRVIKAVVLDILFVFMSLSLILMFSILALVVMHLAGSPLLGNRYGYVILALITNSFTLLLVSSVILAVVWTYPYQISTDSEDGKENLSPASWERIGVDVPQQPKTAAGWSVEWLEKTAAEGGDLSDWAKTSLSNLQRQQTKAS